jgi:hypothetical protein
MREYFFLKTKIGRRFLAGFLILALLTPVIGGWLAIRRAESAIRRQTFAVLRAASDGVEAELREFVHHFRPQLVHLSQHEQIRKKLEMAHTSAPTPADISSFLDLLFSQSHELPDIQEIFVLTLDGRVYASSTVEDIGRDYSSADFFVHGKQSFFQGDIFRDDRTGEPTWVMTCPIKDASMNRVLGIMAIRIDPRDLNALMSGRRILALGANTQSFRIGDTGESYIVNRDHFMITDSRFFPGSVLKRKVDTLPVRVAFETGQEVATEYTDYRGYKVSGASFILRNFNWVVLTEIDFTQAFAPIKDLRREMIIWMIFLVFLAAVCSSIYTSRLLKPIRLLREADSAFASRDVVEAFVS